MSKLKEEQGSGLVLTLMVLMVLAVLAAALATVTLGSYQLTANNRDSVSAYYIAEAELNTEFEQVTTIVNDKEISHTNSKAFFLSINEKFELIIGKSKNEYSEQYGKSPIAETSLINTSSGKYKLISKGIVGDSERTVSKEFSIEFIENEIEDKDTIFIPKNAALIVKDKMELTGGGKVTGDIYFDSLTPASFSVNNGGSVHTGKVYINPTMQKNIYPFNERALEQITVKRDFELPWADYLAMTKFSEPKNLNQLPKNKELNGSNTSLSLDKDTYIDSINYGSNQKITIDTGASNIKIYLDDLNLQGNITFVGSGSVELHIMNSLPASNFSLEKGNLHDLKIFYHGTKKVSLGNDFQLNGDLFIGNAELELAGGGVIKGVIHSASNKVTLSNGVSSMPLLIAPKANVKINSTINSIVIAESAVINNGGTLTGQEFSVDKFKKPGSTTINSPIITSQPIIEE